MIEGKRCPWCGVILKRNFEKSFKIDYLSIKCAKCHKWSRPRINLVVVLLMLLFAILVVFCKKAVLIYLYAAILFYYIYKLPNKRISNGKWHERIEDDLLLGNCNILWYPYHKNKMLFTKFRIFNNYILPICFHDKDIAVSQTICVRIERISPFNRNTYRIHALNNNIDNEILINFKAFYVFNKKEIIAEGELL